MLTNEWSVVHDNSTSDDIPEPRRTKWTYDIINNVAVLFGGDTEEMVFGDTWIYNFDQDLWTEITPTISPFAQSRNLIIYDPIHGKTLLYTSRSIVGPDGDFWELQLILDSINQSPIADAGSNQTVVGRSIVTLDGTGSSDLDGDPITYSWNQASGTNVTLSDDTMASPTFVAPSTAGEIMLSFSLVVNDGLIDSLPDSVFITVSPLTTGVICLQEARPLLVQVVMILL